MNRKEILACSEAMTRSDASAMTAPGSGSRAVQRSDDWLVKLTHVGDERASHARELEMSLHVTGQQRANDVVHVAAGAEALAGAGQH